MRTMKRHSIVMPQAVYVRAGAVSLEGELYVPEGARGVVVFVHGGGSSRHSPRDRLIAAKLQTERFATFLFDLLTPEELAKDIQTGEFRCNVGLLALRVGAVTDALARDPAVRGMQFAYLATGTGAAAALIAAADKPARAAAIIARSGRPDLAEAALDRGTAPTLLVVGSEDRETLAFNRKAYALLHCEKKLHVMRGPEHVFEETCAIEELETLVLEWLHRHLEPELAAS